MNQLPMYNKLQYISCDNISDIIFKNSISIPSSSGITSAEQQIVVSEIKNFFKMILPDISNFIKKYITNRKESLFKTDLDNYSSILTSEIKINLFW